MNRLYAAMAAVTFSIFTLSGALAQAPVVSAPQGYPSRPIRIVVPYPAGGGIDVISRVAGQRLAQRLGQPVLIDNRPGGGTILAAEQVAKAAPDGYTLMITTDSTITINPHLYAKLPYDPVRDFVPVTQLLLLNSCCWPTRLCRLPTSRS